MVIKLISISDNLLSVIVKDNPSSPDGNSKTINPKEFGTILNYNDNSVIFPSEIFATKVQLSQIIDLNNNPFADIDALVDFFAVFFNEGGGGGSVAWSALTGVPTDSASFNDALILYLLKQSGVTQNIDSDLIINGNSHYIFTDFFQVFLPNYNQTGIIGLRNFGGKDRVELAGDEMSASFNQPNGNSTIAHWNLTETIEGDYSKNVFGSSGLNFFGNLVVYSPYAEYTAGNDCKVAIGTGGGFDIEITTPPGSSVTINGVPFPA